MTDAVKLQGSYLERMTEEEFFDFCQANRDLRIERDKRMHIFVQSPAGSYTGHLNSQITFQLVQWNTEKKRVLVFDSSTGYTLPDKSVLSPDAYWITKEKWEALALKEGYRTAVLNNAQFILENELATKPEIEEYLTRENIIDMKLANGWFEKWKTKRDLKTVFEDLGLA